MFYLREDSRILGRFEEKFARFFVYFCNKKLVLSVFDRFWLSLGQF